MATAGAAVAGGGALVGALAEFAGHATKLREILGEVPAWLWLLVLAVLAGTLGFLAWRAKRIKDRRVAMHNAAEVA